jgi:hypothetical protein
VADDLNTGTGGDDLVGSLQFSSADLVTVLVPEEDHIGFSQQFIVPMLVQQQIRWPAKRQADRPRWGQERMIACLAGVSPENVGPFPNEVISQ